jgi:hypothetical protein
MELAKLSKSSMAALNKKVEEIPLSLTSIAARDTQMHQETTPGPISDTTTTG